MDAPTNKYTLPKASQPQLLKKNIPPRNATLCQGFCSKRVIAVKCRYELHFGFVTRLHGKDGRTVRAKVSWQHDCSERQIEAIYVTYDAGVAV